MFDFKETMSNHQFYLGPPEKNILLINSKLNVLFKVLYLQHIHFKWHDICIILNIYEYKKISFLFEMWGDESLPTYQIISFRDFGTLDFYQSSESDKLNYNQK